MSEDDEARRAGAPGQREPDRDEELEPAEVLEELLEGIVDGLGLDVEIEVEERDGVLSGRLKGEDVGLFIGKRGQTIDAVQHLAQRIVFPQGPSSVRVAIDAGGYRERRTESLCADADDAAEEALRSDRPVELVPMPPWERRVVHEHLRERGGVETHSEGDEPERRLVVSPAAE
jgi:spoIIIJ-associated protein